MRERFCTILRFHCQSLRNLTNVLLFRSVISFINAYRCGELRIEWRRSRQLRHWWRAGCCRTQWGSDCQDTCRLDNLKCCNGKGDRLSQVSCPGKKNSSRITLSVFSIAWLFGDQLIAAKTKRTGGHTDNRTFPKDADDPKETARTATHEMWVDKTNTNFVATVKRGGNLSTRNNQRNSKVSPIFLLELVEKQYIYFFLFTWKSWTYFSHFYAKINGTS